MAERLLLASASPRRRTLLAAAELAFEVAAVEVDEELEEFEEPEAAAMALARRKALARALEETRAGRACDTFVIGADTLVAVPRGTGWRLLGKPIDAAEERSLLALLSGTRHAVVTGVAVVRGRDLAEWSACELTWVTMRAWSAEEIEAYVASEEWRDKAGGYAIQESADRFVTALEGGLDNVVGMPVALVRKLLALAGASRA